MEDVVFDSTKKLNVKGFVITHLNVRSLLRHKDESFYYLDGNDIVCFSEMWLRPKSRGDTDISKRL